MLWRERELGVSTEVWGWTGLGSNYSHSNSLGSLKQCTEEEPGVDEQKVEHMLVVSSNFYIFKLRTILETSGYMRGTSFE
jgi:hypothetical protein